MGYGIEPDSLLDRRGSLASRTQCCRWSTSFLFGWSASWDDQVRGPAAHVALMRRECAALADLSVRVGRLLPRGRPGSVRARRSPAQRPSSCWTGPTSCRSRTPVYGYSQPAHGTRNRPGLFPAGDGRGNLEPADRRPQLHDRARRRQGSGRSWAGASRAAVATRGFSAPSASSWATRGVT